MNNNFQISKKYNSIIIKNGDIGFSVERYLDGDIWFISKDNNLEFIFNFSSRNREEWRSYIIFESLIKLVIGTYMLNDYGNEYSLLPKDFINLEDKSIIWHSDDSDSNILKLKYKENIIKVLLYRNTNDDKSVKVRIRTDGSCYGYYYQEFEKFFKQLYNFAHEMDMSKEKNNKVKKLNREF